MNYPLKLIVGLGNPGPEYFDTRHNAGFMVVDRLLAGPGRLCRREHRLRSVIFHFRYAGVNLLLAQPQTFMNVSGRAVAAIQRDFGLSPEQILVVYDCMDLPLGRLRVRQSGSSGGHKGMESISQALGTEAVPRLRIGIGRDVAGDSVDHVLSPWGENERKLLNRVLDHSAAAVRLAVRSGVVEAMNRYNGMSVED